VVERPTFLDAKNAAFVAALVMLVVLTAAGWLGLLQDTLRNLEEESVRQTQEIETLGTRVRTMEALGAGEQARLTELAEAFRAQTTPMGENADPEVIRETAKLFQAVGIHRVRVTVEDGERGGMSEPREPLPVTPLEGGAAFLLVPHPVRVQAQAGFDELRRALDRLADGTVPVQVDGMTLLRDGSQIRGDLELVYWSREERS
jgi:hypothetical protein